jgi:arsenite-transporting ATPase
MRLVLYTGKGGVGKTTTACATALCAAARGRRTLLASADAAHSLGDALELRLGSRPTPVAPCLDALELDARTEMASHWGKIRDYLVSVLRYQGLEEVVAEELALLPGAEELSTLLGVEEHCRSGRYDLIVLDCAPTDSTLRLVTLPEVARGALRVLLHVQQALSAVVTPLARSIVPIPLPDAAVFRGVDQLLFRKLRALRKRLVAESSSVRLVVTPERMVIDEARRAFTDLALFEIPCDAVVMNRLLPPVAAREAFFHDWGRLQEERRREVDLLFAPLPVLPAPLRDDELMGIDALRAHGEELFGARAPDGVLGVSGRVRFARDATGYRVDLPLPHAERAGLDVAKLEDELVVRSAGRRRALKLPRRLAALSLASARLEHDVLVVRFGAAPKGPEPGR